MLNISSSIHYIYDSTFGALFDKNKNLDPWIRRMSIEQKTELCKTIRCIEIVFRKYPNAREMINIQNNNSSGRFPYTPFSNEQNEFHIDPNALKRYLETRLMCDTQFSSAIRDELLALFKPSLADGNSNDFEAAHALERHLLSQAPEIILNILDEFPLSISDVFDSFHIPQAAARAFCLMDLREATLKDWEMNNVQLPELDFSGARMEKVQLRGNDLSRIVMKNAFLYEVQFTSSNLTGADMSFTEGRTIDLKRCTLDDANLVSSSFDDIKLVHAKLNYTNLSGAKLQNVFLFDTDLSTAKLADSSIALSETQLIQFKCKAYREEQLEHSHDWIGLTLLQSIDSIDNQYAEVKFSLMDQVIQKLIEINASGEDITGTYASFKDILLRNPIYFQNNGLSSRINSFLTPYEMNSAEDTLLNFSGNPKKLDFLLAYAHTEIRKSPGWAIEHSCGINQLLYHAEYARFENEKRMNPESAQAALTPEAFALSHKAEALRELYYKALPPTLVKQLDLVRVWSEEQEGVQYPVGYFTDPHYFVFISKNQSTGIISDEKYYQSNILGNKEKKWGNAFFFERKIDEYKSFIPENMALFLKDYPLLDKIYSQADLSVTQKFLEILPWGKVNRNPGTSRVHYLEIFQIAFHAYWRITNLTDSQHTEALQNIFGSLWEGAGKKGIDTRIKITPEHQHQIITHYTDSFKDINISDRKNQSYLFFSLAILFTKYSSNYMFGAEGESLVPLRCYVVALLNVACELNPGEHALSSAKVWCNRLLGQNVRSEFTCAAEVFDDMHMTVERSSNQQLKGIYARVTS
ncbi:Putative secreted effector protein [Candidatus Glomeribacter gigasporarum BEG34]|uniref:Putative secreted effector protein n=2 Tax=Candidatus Glomeribacter gigasporarum TaxID=132144 RepID=G2J8Q1_9BURK|nr:Putative secreted effector protein [Candidatus Glomeribacter gigasporarum BEG34]